MPSETQPPNTDDVAPADTAELVVDDAPDRTPAEVTDPGHPDHVAPYEGAAPIAEET